MRSADVAIIRIRVIAWVPFGDGTTLRADAAVIAAAAAAAATTAEMPVRIPRLSYIPSLLGCEGEIGANCDQEIQEEQGGAIISVMELRFG
jgi:hypothetical protein